MSDNATTDVATILEQLRAEVRAQRQAQGAESAERAAYQAIDRELMHCAEQLELTRAIVTHWPLQGDTIPQRLLVLVHRFVRHSLKWYINPIADQQNAFNEVTARTLRLLIDSYREQRDLLACLEQEQAQNAPDSTTMAAAQPDVQGLSDDLTVLQAWVETQSHSLPMAALGDLELHHGPPLMAVGQHVSAHAALARPTTLLQQARVLAQRLLRWYLRWWINPIVEQQNAFNAAATQTVRHLVAADAELRAATAAVRARRAGG